MGSFRRTKASVIILGIAMLLLGLAIFITPTNGVLFVTLCFGWLMLFAGIATLIGHFRHNPADRGAVDLVLAILEVIIGLLVVIFPAWWVLYVMIIIGIMILITGIYDIVDAFAFRSAGAGQFALWLVLGILTIIFGIMVFCTPFVAAEAIMIVAAVALVFDGITEIVAGVRM